MTSVVKPYFIETHHGSVCVRNVPVRVCKCGVRSLSLKVARQLEAIRANLELYESQAPPVVEMRA